MTSRALVRRLRKEDIDFVINNIRDADRIEIEDQTGLSYIDILNRIDVSDNAWVGIANGDIIAIFGVRRISYLSGNGAPWMISTIYIEKHPLTFIRYCKRVVKEMSKGYSRLYNFVDERNKLSQMWLKWLGFKLHDPVPYGPNLKPFIFFEMEVEKTCAIQ